MPRIAFGVMLLLLAAAGSAHAQSPRQFLPREPGAGFKSLREVSAPEKQDISLGPASDGTAGFILRGVELEGAASVPIAELRPLWSGLLGQPVALSTLDALAESITAAYRARGYVLSQAILPEQTVSAGIVRFRVIEGFIDRIALNGGKANQQAYAEQLFTPVARERPSRLSTLERAVLLARDTFGGTVETVLEPSASTFGAADLNVLMDPDPWRAFAAADNRGSRLYGDLTASGGVSAYNLFGLNEQTDLLIAGAPQNGSLAYGQARLETPLPMLMETFLNGSRLILEGSRSRARPNLTKSGSPQDLNIIQHETNARIGFYAPFIRSRSQNLLGRLSLDWQKSESDTAFAGTEEGSTDKLLVLEARLSWDKADSIGGITLFDATLRQGLSVPGLTQIGGTGPAAGQANFTSLALTLSRLQRIGAGPWSVYVETIGQLASTVLPNAERFALGDATIGRGFAPGNTTGDSGYGGRLEIRRALGPTAFQGMFTATELYVFGDYGSAYDRSIDRDGEAWESLGSVGFGARIDVTPWLTLTPEIARQMTGVATDTTDPNLETRAYIGLVARF